MQRAGHSDFDTTQIYLREAENLAAGFGAVFPPIPADVLRGWSFGSVSAFVTDDDGKDPELLRDLVELTGIEPFGLSSR
jgi:hypothetical protein